MDEQDTESIYREMIVRFPMRKGEGVWPDISKLPNQERTTSYIRECMQILIDYVDFDEDTDIEDCELLDAGLNEIELKNGLIEAA